ncbi:hypothetical protein MASR2M39_29920 [Ignavibacteriales bacterium]
MIPNLDGGLTTPSVIWYNQDEIYVGKKAVAQKTISGSNSIEFIKRGIGKGESSNRYEIWGEEYTPEELSALLLYRLVKDANIWLKNQKLISADIQNVVITVPANFNDNQRNATKLAGSLAGLNVLSIINEPTAAAIAHGVAFTNNIKFLVFDLGGGTFDLTLMGVRDQNNLEVFASDGHMELGGKD